MRAIRIEYVSYVKGRYLERWRYDEDPRKSALHIGGQKDRWNEGKQKWEWMPPPKLSANLTVNGNAESAASPSSESRQQRDAATVDAAMLDAAHWLLEQAGAQAGGPKPISPANKN